LLEHGYNHGAAARHILTAHGFAEVRTQQDLAGLDRLTFGMFRHVE
ncbi:peptide chain release factor N(5)-glutamine methyltransferase, partial [Neisseria sp. P0021.S007]